MKIDVKALFLVKGEFVQRRYAPPGDTVQRSVCFMHAVKRAEEGQQIEVLIISESNTPDCHDCLGVETVVRR